MSGEPRWVIVAGITPIAIFRLKKAAEALLLTLQVTVPGLKLTEWDAQRQVVLERREEEV